MQPISFQGQNLVLQAPAGEEENINPLPVFADSEEYISCWQLTEDELAQLQTEGKIYLRIFAKFHPPVLLQVETPFEAVAVQSEKED